METFWNVRRGMAAAIIHVHLLVSGAAGLSTRKIVNGRHHTDYGVSDISPRATAPVGTPCLGCTISVPPAFISHAVGRHHDRTAVRIDPRCRSPSSRNEEGVCRNGGRFSFSSCQAG